jgi:phosphatidylinositol alpha-1,6-mannosyltransferase
MATIVLTPNLTGRDGVSHLSRLIVRACRDVTVIALHERTSLRTFEHATVSAAGGRNARYAALALQHAAASDAETTVIVVHLHLAPAALAFAARGATLATCLCGIEAWAPLNWAQRALLLRSTPLFAISAHTAERFAAANPRLAHLDIAVCHPGIESLPRALSTEPSRNAPPVALIVGRMAADERYKGHDLLLDVWADVTARVPDARLEVVGDGDDRTRLEQKAAALGLSSCVDFLGRVDEKHLRACYARCSVLAMPSRDEGFGLVFVEAMRAGRACIAAPGAAAEVIDAGRSGFIVDPARPSELVRALVRLLGDRRCADAMGAAARDRFVARFTEEQFRARLTALVPHVAASPVPA